MSDRDKNDDAVEVIDEPKDKEIILNLEQSEAASFAGKERNILVLAGAGCGKTKTTIARAEHLIKSGSKASRILMMTFTNRAAREIKNRLKTRIGPKAQQIQAGTFHGFCLKIMSKIPKSFEIDGLNIIDADDQSSLMSRVRGKFINRKSKEFKKAFPKVPHLISYYSYSRNTCQDARSYLSDNSEMNEDHIELCCNMFNEYQKEKESRGYLDFDDLLDRFGRILSRKPKLRKAVGDLYDEVIVDEMQDSNPLQMKILEHFSHESVRLFCVGDPAQSIYKFRGAEFEHVFKFGDIFSDTITLPLSMNYRSYQEILNLANWLLGRSPLDYKNNLIANRGSSGNLPVVAGFDSSFDEASWVADKIIEHREDGSMFRDIMILVRTSYDAQIFEVEFLQRELPYYFIGGMSLTKSAHVRDLLSLLRVVRNSQDDLAWMRYLKLWPGIGDKSAERIVESFFEVSGSIPGNKLVEILGQDHKAVLAFKRTSEEIKSTKKSVSVAIKHLAPVLKERYDKWSDRRKDLDLLATVSERYESINDFINAFTLEPMTNTEIRKLDNDDAVKLITVHSAKGTEAPICFIVNATPGTYPHVRSYGDEKSEEEERRVLYVALTRAKDKLYITRSTNYRSSFFIRNKPTIGEEYFLSKIPSELIHHEIGGWSPDDGTDISGLRDVF